MKKRILRLTFWLIAGFALLFLFRIAYSYSEKDVYDGDDGGFGYFDASSITRKNYASDSYKFRKEEPVTQMNVTAPPADAAGVKATSEISVSQKYEKTATIGA